MERKASPRLFETVDFGYLQLENVTPCEHT